MGVPIGTDECVLERALEVMSDGGVDRLACCLANMTDKQAAALIAIESLGQLPREGSGHGALPRSMQKGRQRGAVGVRKNHRATRSSGGTAVIFPGGVPGKSADFKPSPASPCTPFHGSGKVKAVPSTEARRMSASIGSRVGTLPEVIADFTGPLGGRVRRGLPESNIIAQLGGSLRDIRDKWGVTKEAMAESFPNVG